MSLGVPFVAVLPTPGVTTSPTFESMLNAWLLEAKGKLEAKAADADILLAGPDVLHGNRVHELAAAAGVPYIAVATTPTYNAAHYWLAAAANNAIIFSLPVQVGQRIKDVAAWGRAGTTAWTLYVDQIDKATGTVTTIGSVTSGTAAAIERKDVALTQAVAAGVAYVARVLFTDAAHRCYGAALTVDKIS